MKDEGPESLKWLWWKSQKVSSLNNTSGRKRERNAEKRYKERNAHNVTLFSVLREEKYSMISKYCLLVLSELYQTWVTIHIHNLCGFKIFPPFPPLTTIRKRVITVICSKASFQISAHFQKGREGKKVNRADRSWAIFSSPTSTSSLHLRVGV